MSPSPPRVLTLDVLVGGEPARRGVTVECASDGVRFEGGFLDPATVFEVSHRAGLVLVVSAEGSLAFAGDADSLEEVARAVRRGAGGASRRALLQPLAGEVVVCSAAAAVSGRLAGEHVGGVYFAVFTRHGLHLFAGNRRHHLPWPVERAAEKRVRVGGATRPVLELAGGDTALTIRYLFAEEIWAVTKVARTVPDPAPASSGPLEMFGKGEVAPPPPARAPEFPKPAESLSRALEPAVGRVRIDPSLGERFERPFFERHLKQLAEIAFGPLLARRSAAHAADSPSAALAAMDGEQLGRDAEAAFRRLAAVFVESYAREVRSVVRAKRLDREHADKALAALDEEWLGRAVERHLAEVAPALETVRVRQEILRQLLDARHVAPPDHGDEDIDRAVAEWREEVGRLDAAYAAACDGVLLEAAGVWSDRLIPALRGLAALRGRRLSERARLAILALVTLLVAAALAVLVFGPEWIGLGGTPD